MDKFQNIYRIESARLKNWDYGRNAWYYVTICTGQRRCFFGDITDGKIKYSQTGDIARQLWMEIPNQFGYANLDEYIVMPNHIHGIIQINKPNPPSHPHPEKYNRLENGAGVGGDDGIGRDGATGGDGGDGIGRDGATGGGRDAINRVSTIDRTTIDPNMNVPTSDDRTTNDANKNAPTTNDPNMIDQTTNNPTTNHPTSNDPTTNIPTPKNRGGVTGNYNPMLHDNLSRILRWYKGRVTFEAHRVADGFSWQSRFHDRIIRNEEQLNRIRKYIVNNPRNWNNDEWYIP